MPDAPGPITPSSTPTIGDLYAEAFVPAGTPKGVVVVSHGYAEHCGRYREVAHVITNAGWAALTYDVRGHGKSPGPRGYIDRFATYLTDLDRVIAHARTLAPGAPVILLGHSHGSLIVLRALAGEHPPRDIRAAFLSSPYLALKLPVPAWQLLLARVANKIAPKLNQPNGIKAEQLTSDKEMQRIHDADPLNFPTATVRWFIESRAAQDQVLANAARITVPTTWFVGGADPIADPARSRQIADKVKGATYHDLVGMLHEVFNEAERGKVFAELARALASA